MEGNQRGNGDGWRLDKRISVEIVVLVVVQAIAFTWFMSKMDSRVQDLEDDGRAYSKLVEAMPTMESRMSMVEGKTVDALQVIDRISKLEAQVNSLQELVRVQSTVINRIDRKLPTFKELDEQQDSRP